jgi:Zn-dependent protease with chaperone function
MDFFGHQEAARRRTKWLVFYFAAAIACIIAALHAAFCAFAGQQWDNWELLGATAAGVLAVVAVGSLVKIAELAKGGRAVAEMLGGAPVNTATRNPSERRLLNVVEEMAIASGMAVPQVYVLDDAAINAFAAGYGARDAVVGVTRGCMEQLTRDELQGVVAHEFSHILNGDMRLNIRLIGLLNGILFLAVVGGVLMRIAAHSRGGRSRNDKGGGSIVMVVIAAGLALYLVGWIGVFFGKLIKAAVSRQREFLADASAVQFTRDPNGIAGALEKIGGVGSRLGSPRAQEASHMFFGNGLAESWFQLFATHPPISERVSRIRGIQAAAVQAAGKNPPPLPAAADAAAGASLLAGIPAPAQESARDLFGACGVVYGLLLSNEESIRKNQLRSLQADEALKRESEKSAKETAALGSGKKIALVELVVPTLRGLSPQQAAVFRSNIEALVAADGRIHLFEYALQKMLLRHLADFFGTKRRGGPKVRSLVPLLPDVGFVLSAVANAEDGGTPARDRSFAAGAAALGSAKPAYPLERLANVDLREFDAALERLDGAVDSVKSRVLEACEAAAMADGKVNGIQFELVRAISDTLGFPMPPAVETA